MLEVARFGPVVRIRMSRSFLGRPAQWVNAFWVDGLLIDSGCPRTAPELLRALEQEGLRVEQLVNTHTHEDHVGANAELHRRYGVTPRAHPLALGRLAAPETSREMHAYRRFFWGVPEGCPGKPVGDVVETGRYRFRVLHTPGHAPDHIALFEEQEGWLFPGDLMLSPRLVYIRVNEDPLQILASMRVLAALPVRRLFCSHAWKVHDSAGPLQAKIERWEEMQREGLRLQAAGEAPSAIVRRLAGPGSPIEWLSFGDYARRNLVAGLLRGGQAHG